MADFTGSLGSDSIVGTSGNDRIYDASGDDVIDGGGGDDLIQDDRGNDTLTGGVGNDTFLLRRAYVYQNISEIVTIYGGSGNDTLIADLSGQTQLLGNMGAGDDNLRLSGYLMFDMSLGDGRDTVHLNSFQYGTPNNKIRDFVGGASGDVFNVSDAIQLYTDGVTNPFASGHLVLKQVGANAVLYFDYSGTGTNPQEVIVTFVNTSVSSLTGANFFGFNPNKSAIAAGKTINGTAAGEYIDGTAGADTIYGGDGDDVVYGYYSADNIYGEAGNDVLYGGGGVDLLEGGEGDDVLDGGAQYDTLLGGDGNDRLTGGDWHADYLDGGNGNDILTETGANDTMIGGDGDDTITHLRFGAPTIDAGAGNDLVTVDHGRVVHYYQTTSYSFTIAAGSGNDEVHYSSEYLGSVSIYLGTGADTLNLASGMQTVQVFLGAGSDRFVIGNMQEYNRETIIIRDFQAGAGGDVYDVMTSLGSWGQGWSTWDGETNPFATGHVKLVPQGDDVLVQFDRDGSASDYAAFTVAVLKKTTISALTSFNFDGASPDGSAISGVTLNGTDGADTLIGTIRPDTLNGLGGDDRIEGRAGNDVIDGGDGNDHLIGGDGFDRITGGLGDDRIEDHGRINIIANAGNDTIIVGNSNYVETYGTINGGDGDDFITATMVTNTRAHTDTINAGAGNDTVTYEGGSAPGTSHFVQIDLGSGNDVLNLKAAGSFSNPLITTGAGADRINVLGSYGVDGGPTQAINPISIVITDFTPGSGGDVFDFSGYVQQRAYNIIGTNPFAGGFWARLVQVGNDTVLEFTELATSGRWYKLAIFENTTVDQFTDYNFGYDIDAPSPDGLTLTAAAEGGNLRGTFLDDTFYGSAASDTVEGQGGNDRIFTYGGNDWIYAGAGNDYINAGAGDDYIENGAGNDTIIAGSGSDYIVLTHAGATIDGGTGYDVVEFRDEFYRTTGGLIFDQTTFASSGSFTMAGNQVTKIEQVLFLDGTNGADRITYGAAYAYNVWLNGRDGNDTLHGGKTEDVISGGNGDDRIFGFGGIDQLAGEAGDDFLDGGDGDDYLIGGVGNDIAYGQDGNDELYGEAGDDFLRGGLGADLIDGGTGTDDIEGGPGNDVLSLDISAGDVISGGKGFDRLVLSNYGATTAFYADFTDAWTGGNAKTTGGTFTISQIESIEAELGSGNDTLLAGASFAYAVTLNGGAGNDHLGGGNARDLIRGDQGDDLLYGFGGNDEIWGDHLYQGVDGKDVIYGGDGDDILYGQGGNDVLHGEAGDDILAGGTGNDRFFGGDGSDVILGNEGDDVISGGTGRDTIYGGAGRDIVLIDVALADYSLIDGGSEYDIVRAVFDGGKLVWTGSNITGVDEIDASRVSVFYIVGTTGGDFWDFSTLKGGLSDGPLLRGNLVFDAGAGNDTILAKAGNQTLNGGDGNDVIDGRAGADKMSGGKGDDRYYVDNTGDLVIELAGQGTDEVFSTIGYTLGANVENLYLLGVAKFATGNALANNIVGNDAANTINGMAGDDLLDGGAGDDIIYGGLGNDEILGGWGNDRLNGGDGNDTVFGSLGVDKIWGGAGQDVIFGEDGADTIYGGDDDDAISGGNGNDILYGEAGNDVIIGEFGNDKIFGDDGDDWLEGGDDADTLNGGVGSDFLWGGYGDDILIGGAGDDHIIGDNGKDTMTGGTGADFFYALGDETPPGLTPATADRITDFNRSEGDKIVLDAIDANLNMAGDQAFTWRGTAAFTKVAGQLRYAFEGGNTMIYGDVDGDGQADFAIRLDGQIDLIAADFVL